jgi:AraC-like DNA-binding protein
MITLEQAKRGCSWQQSERNCSVEIRLLALAAMEPRLEQTIYREFSPPRDLAEHLLCVWVLRRGAEHGRRDVVLPDACMDLVCRPDRGIVVAGPDTRPAPVTRPAGSTVVGVRFRPGAGPAMLGLPADELLDLRVPVGAVWGDGAARLEEDLAVAATARQKLELIEREVRRRLAAADRPDRVVAAAVRLLGGPEPPRVRRLGDELGISERQLRRRFRAAVGYGPKTLARVLRFQRMLALARNGSQRGDLARLALEAGYADQAHMTVECTRLAGLSPGRLLAER